MKLLYCRKCHHVFKLSGWDGACLCGGARGRYHLNGIDAVYSGEHAVPLGIANGSLLKAIAKQPLTPGPGERFEAFVIPVQCETFRRVNPAPTGISEGEET